MKQLCENIIISLANKKDFTIIIENINNSDNDAWLNDYFKDEKIYEDTTINIALPDLFTNKEKSYETDFENSKIIFEAMLPLSNATTCSESFWESLTFGAYYKYMKYRWPLTKPSNYEKHWIFSSGKKRSLFLNGLSRLFWYAKYTYDETLNDPYEITKFCFQDVNTFNELVYRSYSNSKHIRLALLKALKQFKDKNSFLGMDVIRYAANYVSFLGGAYLLDSFTEDELIDKILSRITVFKLQKNKKQNFNL